MLAAGVETEQVRNLFAQRSHHVRCLIELKTEQI